VERALALFVLSLVASPVAHAADAGDCRNLLTLDEVAAAVGGAAKLTNAGKRGEIGSDSVDKRLEVCTWAANTWLAGVNVDVARSLEATDVTEGLEIVAYPLDEKRKQHWSEDRLDFGGVHCSSLSPPPPSTEEPQVTGCVGEVKGAALYVGISSRIERPTFDRTKRLFDAAAARL
jgi:hypothetical protein